MKQLRECLKTRRSILLLCMLIALGAAMRIAACYWGYPYQLHPDEPTVVLGAIDLIKRHSYEVTSTYARPDHFEIKCCALLFQIVSYLKYHVSADVAFSEHRMAFYLIARAYTALFGAMTIGLIYKVVEKIRPQAKMIAAVLVTFFPIFVDHSAYATPDVVLSFFVLLIAYFSILYLQEPSMKYLTLMCAATGIGITVKYPCAIACIWIALVVCINCIRKKKYLDIVKLGFYSVFVVFAACFFCAPNLFTDISSTIELLVAMGEPVHLGADRLGFFGNFKYYLTTFLNAAGYETVICALAGILFCLKNRNAATLSMGMGLLFWVCISVLALHWERWGVPSYVFFIALDAIGISYLFELAKKKWIRSVVAVLGFVMVCNSVVSGLLMVQSKLTTEARVDAIQFCTDNGISWRNTLYDGYSPINVMYPATIDVSFDEQGNITVPSNIQYLVLSSGMYARFYAEPERYARQVGIYDNIQNSKQLELIYNKGGSYYTHLGAINRNPEGSYYKHSNAGIINIVQAVKGLVSHNSDTIGGYQIKIYRILGDTLDFGDFALSYVGDKNPVLDENNHTLKLLLTANEPDCLYLNANGYRISYHLYDRDGNMVKWDRPRTEFGSFTGSQEIDMEVDILEKGLYTLELDVVQEGVVWLSVLGMQTERIDVEIR